MSYVSQYHRQTAGRVWRLLLQCCLPGFLLHEAAHWLVARVVAVDARLLVTPGWRVTCASAWNEDCDTVARRSAVAFAPVAWALAALPGVALVVGAVLDTGSAVAIAVTCWGWLNLLVLGAPSPSDFLLAARSPRDRDG
jgi:hypothetical protein